MKMNRMDKYCLINGLGANSLETEKTYFMFCLVASIILSFHLIFFNLSCYSDKSSFSVKIWVGKKC